MNAPLRVGIIGANPHRGWAPARTCRRSPEAAERFGARNAYGDPLQLMADPEVEAATVAVKVPEHFVLVALGARIISTPCTCRATATTAWDGASSAYREYRDRGRTCRDEEHVSDLQHRRQRIEKR
jgi:hypothetical protein